MLRLKMYPAKNGDAFLVDAGGTHILVDCGFASTYHEFIAGELEQLAKLGGRLDLAVCTHIDADHIGGLLEFISLNGAAGARGIEVSAVWHNSLRSLSSPSAIPDVLADQRILEAVRRRGFPTAAATLPTAISSRQGSSLGKLLRQQGYNWNSGEGLSSICESSAPTLLAGSVSIQVIGPTAERLEGLRKMWLNDMRRVGYTGSSPPSDLVDDAFEMWCASALPSGVGQAAQIASKSGQRLADVYTPDTSIPNGSSIAFIVSRDGARALFLGDAWAEDVASSLKALHPGIDSHMFDAIKVSHHGSLHNTSAELLAVVDSPCFLISSDGSRHGHPDFEVLAEIVDRPASFERHLFFNYETPAARQLQSHISRSGAAFTVHIGERGWIQVGDNKT